MDDNLKKNLLRYEELKISEKEIKAELDSLKEEIFPLLKDDEKINCAYGVIEIKKKDIWTYSPDTTRMAENLKEKQKEEIAKGIAISKPTVYMEYRLKDKDVV